METQVPAGILFDHVIVPVLLLDNTFYRLEARRGETLAEGGVGFPVPRVIEVA
jgi:hypothetical protein